MITLLLALLYPIAIQIERGGWWRLLAPVTLFALLVDVIANYTELVVLTFDFPRRGEWTFSTRLERLVLSSDWRGRAARPISRLLNWIAPTGHPHIKNAIGK
ncbi:hypothetical protein [Rhodoferax aquaticus]|uniref:Uncharacterized protein n=1 Tax=Rhodoferax aquaticus TaxID=2527691 RepID=A0A515ERK0_9BURK|nr:hypothetical protein [Rhodoferax aquaticus]QDL55292.1 hypothetical protein EXZ61_14575 [Rhodoferax aquaticus]